MNYTLTDLTTGLPVVRKLETFFLLYDFTVGMAAGVVTVTNGYFAAFVSQSSAAPDVGPVLAANPSYQLTDVDGNSFVVNHATLVKKPGFEVANEKGTLYLFALNPVQMPKANWFSGTGWAPPYTPRTRCDGNTPFWAHSAQFVPFIPGAQNGNVPDNGGNNAQAGNDDPLPPRQADAIISTETAAGVDSCGVIVPLLANSFFAEILKADGMRMPALNLTTPKRPWDYFTKVPLPAGPAGFAMIAEGAFQDIRLLELPSWHIVGPDQQEILAEKLLTVMDRASPLSRTLGSASRTDRTGVIQPTAKGPVEVVYLTGLQAPEPLI